MLSVAALHCWSYGILCTGVFALGLFPGVHESIDSVRFAFDRLNFDDLVEQCERHGGEIIMPVDMKMQGLALGLQNQSAIYPMPYDLWSQRTKHSEPEVSFAF